MFEMPDLWSAFLLAGGILLLFAFAWVTTASLPKFPRLLARLCLVGLAVLPLVLVLVNDRSAELPTTAAPPAAEEPAPSVPESAPGELPPAPLPTPVPTPEPTPAPSKPPSEPPQPPAPKPGTPVPDAQAPEAEAPDAGGSRGLGDIPPPASGGAPTGGAVPPPPPARDDTKAEEKTFDVVPVYFGTDRADASTPKRLDYGPQRGRRLALGQALVTVPKNHEVPQVERPWAVNLPLIGIVYQEAEDPAEHFTMKELKELSRDALLALVRERLSKSARFKDHALVFVHGFNTTFDNAVYRTAQIAYDLKFDGAPFLYSWPSGGGVASYTYDRESAGQAGPFLREFLDLVVKDTGAKSVSIIAHSMGNQPTLQVLKDIRASTPGNVVISEIILAAPDVDRDNFENIAREIQGLAKGITLYAARNDYALDVSRRFHGGVPRAGDAPDGKPLVLPGIDTIDVSAVSTDSFGLNHSGYAENNALLNDIQLLLQTGERPPEKRIPVLEKVETDKGAYWRFPATP